MPQVIEITHPKNANLYSVKVDENQAAVYCNTGTDESPFYVELTSVNFNPRSVNWYSGGSRTGVKEARQMGEALDIAEAVVALLQAHGEFTREALEAALDFVLE